MKLRSWVILKTIILIYQANKLITLINDILFINLKMMFDRFLINNQSQAYTFTLIALRVERQITTEKITEDQISNQQN